MKRFIVSIITALLYCAVCIGAMSSEVDIGVTEVNNDFDLVYIPYSSGNLQPAQLNSCKGHENEVIFNDLFAYEGIQIVELILPNQGVKINNIYLLTPRNNCTLSTPVVDIGLNDNSITYIDFT